MYQGLWLSFVVRDYASVFEVPEVLFSHGGYRHDSLKTMVYRQVTRRVKRRSSVRD